MPIPPPLSHWQNTPETQVRMADGSQQCLARTARGTIDQRFCPGRACGSSPPACRHSGKLSHSPSKHRSDSPVFSRSPDQHLVATRSKLAREFADPRRFRAKKRPPGVMVIALVALAHQIIGDRFFPRSRCAACPLSRNVVQASMIRRVSRCAAMRQRPSCFT